MNPENKFSTVEVLQQSISKPRISTARGVYMKSLLELAHNKSRMIGLADTEGSGKTTAVAEYFFDHENVIYIKVGQSFSNKRVFHELISYVSGDAPAESTNLYSSMRQLERLLLEKRNVKKLIVVDDAAKLSVVGLGLFHELRDYTTSCTGIVFIGLPLFQKKLLKWRSVKQGIGEFYRRVQAWHGEEIPPLSRSEKISFCHLNEMTDPEIFDQFVNDCSTFSELEKYIDRLKEIQVFERTKEMTRRKKNSKFDLEE